MDIDIIIGVRSQTFHTGHGGYLDISFSAYTKYLYNATNMYDNNFPTKMTFIICISTRIFFTVYVEAHTLA
jgi:hypothetical protein